MAVIPSNIFNSAVVAVTPSSTFNSAAVDVTSVPPISSVVILASPETVKPLRVPSEVTFV